MTVDQFEALVQSQKPASEPWKPVTDYSFEAREAIEGEHPQRIVEVFNPERVLDVGCGEDAILVRLLAELGVNASGIDPNESGCTYWNPGESFHGDIVKMNFWFRDDFDLVICREVLEHLTIYDIRRAVTHLCEASSRFVYVTTRFHLAPTHLLDVATSDDLDPTHITMLNKDFLRLLFVLEGFTRRADLEEGLDWQKKGRVLVYERAS